MRAQRGVSIVMVVVVLAILATALLATMALTRVTDNDAARQDTNRRLAKAAEALDQFAAAQHRLPCPADPTIDTGLEAITAVGSATCQNVADEGTLPWKTLGLVHEDGYDAWGDKLSYRVYTGNKGSLVQPEAINMTECDTVDTGGPTSTSGSAGGLCVTSANPLLRSTSLDKYLQGKSLNLTENGASRNYVAYLVISHGATGYGAYTVSGVRKSISDVKGDELKNTTANGPFTIQAFSDSDVEANSPQHFDDLIVYRTLPDLAKRTGLAARDWPEVPLVFNAANIAAALGRPSVSPGSLGTATINFGTVSATSSTGDLTLIADATSGQGLGATGLFGGYLNNFENNSISFQFAFDATQFAVTLGDFGTFSGFAERARFVFIDSAGAQVASVVKSACRPDGGIASYSITVIPNPPVVSTSQSNSGGTLAASTGYSYRVSAYNGVGESVPGSEVTRVTGNGGGDFHTVSLSWPAVSGATGYRVYGRTAAAEQLLADVGSATSFMDTGAITPYGAMPAGMGFRTVQVLPMSSIDTSGTTYYSFFFVNEINACDPSVASCTTTLASGSNNCP